MAATTLKLKVSIQWWLRAYLAGVVLTARLTRCEPNWERVRYWVGKGIKLKVK